MRHANDLERFPIRSAQEIAGTVAGKRSRFEVVAFPFGKPVSTFPGNALAAQNTEANDAACAADVGNKKNAAQP
jgi:hypothetical protein